MLHFFILIGSLSLARGVNYRKLYKKAVIHFKDPDFEAGNSKYLSTEASKLLKDNVHFQAFKKNAKAVEKQNRKRGREWEAEINEFALETEEEFRSNHLGLNMTKEDLEEIDRQPTLKFSNIDKKLWEELEKKEVDYSAYLPPVRHQGCCGSCWAFSAIASMNYQVNKDRPLDGEMVALSEQQCIDCTSQGCKGGWMPNCFKQGYFQYSHWASVYNYLYEVDDTKACRYENYKNGMSGFKFTSPTTTYVKRHENVLLAVANSRIGVLSASIYVHFYLLHYKSGVFSQPDCNKRPDHAVNIVGYGKQDGIPYWKVRNSWGTQWGEGGYMKMKRGAIGENLNMCRITKYALYPNMEGKDDGQGSGTESEALKLECADDYKQRDYRGTKSTTVSGKTCQDWASQKPHPHIVTKERFPYGGLEKNYCRTPYYYGCLFGCYTTDPSTEWEACSVPDCSKLKWCELSGQKFSSRLEGSGKYKDLDSAKKDCYTDENCSGISQVSDGRYQLMTGVLTPTDGDGVTLQKGVCKEVKKPPAGEYCKMEDVSLTRYFTSAPTLQEALQLCRYHESCVGVSSKEGQFELYTSKVTSLKPGTNSWFKDDCPDLTKCGTGKQADYRGRISTTASGRTCQRWDSQKPHSHTRTPENYPNSGLEENYCRNPDG